MPTIRMVCHSVHPVHAWSESRSAWYDGHRIFFHSYPKHAGLHKAFVLEFNFHLGSETLRPMWREWLGEMAWPMSIQEFRLATVGRPAIVEYFREPGCAWYTVTGILPDRASRSVQLDNYMVIPEFMLRNVVWSEANNTLRFRSSVGA